MNEIYRSQFRFPYSVYEKLKEAADQNHRSVNAELVARLENSFCENSPHNNPEVELLHKLYNESSAKLDELKKITNLGSMELIELNSERATNTMLRHLLAKSIHANSK